MDTWAPLARKEPPADGADGSDPAVVARTFQALADPTRIEILQELAHGEQCVCDLQAELGAAQSRLSFHLRKLKDAGLVTDRREGRWSYYALVPETLAGLAGVLADFEAGARSPGSHPRACACSACGG